MGLRLPAVRIADGSRGLRHYAGSTMGSGKPRGINAARKLRTCRVANRWANKSYKKAHLGTQFKCNPFGGSSHCKGIVLEKMCARARRPLRRRTPCCIRVCTC